MRQVLLGIALLTVTAISAPAQTVGSGGGSTVQPWGKSNTQTYGQTVTAVNSSFDSFSFWLQGGSSLLFQGYIFAWDQATLRATGSALFTSAIMAAPGGSGFQQVLLNTGGVAVTTGNMYVAFLSTSGHPGSGTIQWESGSDGYAGGALVWINNGEDTGQWTGSNWSTNWQGTGSDLRFDATFSAGGVSVVPEPGSMLLLATGLVGLGAAGLKRRRNAA